MSANRSVQAAQRRRAGPPETAPPGRGPQPSINSSQMFAAGQQQRPVTGRLAGQQAAQTQKQMMDQQQANNTSGSAALGGINKMTIAQAITLITLRLGKVETQLLNKLSSNSNFTEEEDHILVDKNVIQSLISRIDALERRPTGSATASPSNQDILLLKQQFETIKPIVIQSKTTSTTLKQQFDTLKNELNETKELVTALQNLTMDNSNKILAMTGDFSGDDAMFLDNSNLNSGLNLEVDENSHFDNNEIVGTNLKELIEQEFNS
jgi:hypothetical protein